MLIICPKCFAQYHVSNTVNSKKNQEYHCTNCNHYFVADPQEELPESESVTTVSRVVSVPGTYADASVQEEAPIKMPHYLEESARLEPRALNPDLGYIPEEFKPVPAPKKKKSSVLVVFAYLAIIGAIGYACYMHRDLIWAQFKGVWANNGLPALDTPVVVPQDKPMAEVKTVEHPAEKTLPAPVLGQAPVPVPARPAAEPAQPETVPVAQSAVVETPAPVVAPAPHNPVALAMAERLAITVAEPTNAPAPVVAPVEQTPTLDMATLKEVLKIEDISYQLGPNADGVNQLLIQGNLVNTDLAVVQSPDLTAVVYDKQDMVVARKHIVPSQKTIEGNTKEQFHTSIIPAPENVGRVEVNFEE